MFIEIEDVQNGYKFIINTNSISFIIEGALTISMNGVHGEGNGLIKVTKEDMERIIEKLKKESVIYFKPNRRK